MSNFKICLELKRTYIYLSELQGEIKSRIGFIQRRVQVEIETHRIVGGHHYLNVIEKQKNGEVIVRLLRGFGAVTSRL